MERDYKISAQTVAGENMHICNAYTYMPLASGVLSLIENSMHTTTFVKPLVVGEQSYICK